VIILHSGLTEQAHFFAAFAVARMWAEDGAGLYGRNESVRCVFDDGDGGEFAVAVWRSKHGINIALTE
jgi:hypothetical protein